MPGVRKLRERPLVLSFFPECNGTIRGHASVESTASSSKGTALFRSKLLGGLNTRNIRIVGDDPADTAPLELRSTTQFTDPTGK